MNCKDKLKRARLVLETVSKGIYADANLSALPLGKELFQQYASELLEDHKQEYVTQQVQKGPLQKSTLQKVMLAYLRSQDPVQHEILGEMLKAYLQLHHDEPEMIAPVWNAVFDPSVNIKPFYIRDRGVELKDDDLELLAELMRCTPPVTEKNPTPRAMAMMALQSVLEGSLENRREAQQNTNWGDLALTDSILDLMLADQDENDLRYVRMFGGQVLSALAERCAFRNQQNDAFAPAVPDAVIAGGFPLTAKPDEWTAAWNAGQPLPNTTLIVSQMKEALLRNAKLVRKATKPRWDSKLGFGRYNGKVYSPKEIFTPEFMAAAAERGYEPIDVALETLTILGMEQGRRNQQKYVGDVASRLMICLDQVKTPEDRKVVKAFLRAAVERGLKPEKDDKYRPPVEDWPKAHLRHADMSLKSVQAVEKAIQSMYRIKEAAEVQGWKWEGLDISGDYWRTMMPMKVREQFDHETLSYNMEDKEWVGSYLEVVTRMTYMLATEQGIRANFPADLLNRADEIAFREIRKDD